MMQFEIVFFSSYCRKLKLRLFYFQPNSAKPLLFVVFDTIFKCLLEIDYIGYFCNRDSFKAIKCATQ